MKLLILLLLSAAAFAQDWTDPSYWGLPKGSYIPKNDTCMGGSFAKAKKHATTDGFDFEMCAVVVAYGETLDEAIEATRRNYR